MPKSESKIQSDFHIWLWNKFPETRFLCYAIPNGGTRDVREAINLKAQGLVAGMPDYHVAIKGALGLTLYIEFKRPGCKARPEQLKAHEALRNAGHAVFICESTEEAQSIFLNHLNKDLFND